VNQWPILGGLMVLVGLAILILLADTVVGILEILLKVIAIFIGMMLILGGLALILGRRWIRNARWGQAPAST
jgi:hypothetical protein